MKRLCSLVFFTMFVILSHGQQDPQFSQSMFNTMVYNPGYVGSRNAICATAINRQQWMGLDGAPVTSVFTVNSPFRLLGGDHGAGVHILNDELGFETNLSINLSYAYRMNAGPGKLGIGVGFGMINSSLDAEWFIPSGDSHTPASGDPSIPVGNESVLTMDFSAGLYYYTEELYIGFSSTHVNQPAIEYTQGANPFLSRNYYLTAGYTLYLENPSYSLLPAMFIQSDGVMTQLNLGGIFEYQNKIWGGAFYRFGSAIVGMAGLELFNGVNLGYSYDFSTTAMSSHSKGTHEFMLRYCFDLGLDRSPQKYRSIRIL
ncbi:MAG: type IX secretion system membrane protein PorP/SprF [Bacteroidales bacterium]